MSLIIKCPDCGSKIAEAAPACPVCSGAISLHARTELIPKDTSRQRRRRNLGDAISIGGIVIGYAAGAVAGHWWIGAGMAAVAVVAGLFLHYR